jgi:hypothetical protein
MEERRRLSRAGSESEPDPEEALEPEEEVEEVEEQHGPRQFPKIRDALLNYEDSHFQHQFFIGDAALEEIGPPGKDGAHNGSGDLFEECREWLLEEYGLDYSARTIKNCRDLAHKVPPSFRQEAEEAGVSITVIQECCGDLETLKALIAAQNGKRSAKLAGLKTTYKGEEMPLASAICKRGRILVSDAKIALGRQSAGGKRGEARDDGEVELTREQEAEIAHKWMSTPELAAEVVEEDPDACKVAYEAASAVLGGWREEEEEEGEGEGTEPRKPGPDLHTERHSALLKLGRDSDKVAELYGTGEPPTDNELEFARETVDRVQENLNLALRGSRPSLVVVEGQGS